MDLCQYYSISPSEIIHLSTKVLSVMNSAMVSNRAIARIKELENLSYAHMKDAARTKFTNGIFKEISEDYNKPRKVSEDELKRILGNV